MGITRLKRLITQELQRNFNIIDLKRFCQNIDTSLDLYTITGYPKNLTIPTALAAKQLVEFFHKQNRFLELINHLILNTKKPLFGKLLQLKNPKAIFFEFNECGFRFDQKLNKVIKFDKNGSRNDWGFLEDNKFYSFSFMSVDICGNSNLLRKYDNTRVKQTYSLFRNYVQNAIKNYHGRIWSWEGDGGLVVFHIHDFVNQSIYSSIKILSNLPIFNATQNLIDEDIVIRIAINAGEIQYKTELNMIQSDVINITKKIEKSHTLPMTVSITKHTLQNCDSLIRKYFKKEIVNGEKIYQMKLPLLGENID